MEEQKDLLERAKKGDPTAVERVAQLKGYVWADEQLEALNELLKVLRSTSQLSWEDEELTTLELRRVPFEPAQPWVTTSSARINPRLKLVALLGLEAAVTYWLFKDDQPLCDVTRWVTQP